MNLIIENIRCFSGRHSVLIKPLTILVGENSTGKSTLLAALSAVCNAASFPGQPGLNDPPYDLGTFDTIATYKGGKYGRDHHFSLGYSWPDPDQDTPREVIATYESKDGQPTIRTLTVRSPRGDITLSFDNGDLTGDVSFVPSESKSRIEFKFQDRVPENIPFSRNVARQVLFQGGVAQSTDVARGERRPHGFMIELQRFLSESLSGPRESVSLAPIRSRPKRTYDEISDEFKPEGGHIPLILARVLDVKSQNKHKEKLQATIQRLGQESGLLTKVGVKKLGRKAGDPFQILVTVAGRPANLPDVGYGVSQALPIIVQSVLATQDRMLLIQQPEVHLHPRAQAALGSLFAEFVAKEKKQLVVETHSDHLLDRLRQEVANKTLSPESLGILFFERHGTETKIHPLKVDGAGNIVRPPRSYRAFFLQEELKLLSRANR